jgi:predicted RNA-binding protein YlxR (DUF448 family)
MSTKAGKRHTPLRSCVICGNKTSKPELLRIVATPDGSVEVDGIGKMPGRGAYVCRDGNCASGSLSRRRVEYALRTGLGDQDWDTVKTAVEALPV